MAYTAPLTKQQLRQRRDATRDRSRDNTKGTVQYLVTYAYTNNNCLLCASNTIVSVAIPTLYTLLDFCNFVSKYDDAFYELIISRLLQVACTMPVTSLASERSFDQLC